MWALERKIEFVPLKERSHVHWMNTSPFSLLFPSYPFHIHERRFYPSHSSSYQVLIVVGTRDHWTTFPQIQQCLVACGWSLNAPTQVLETWWFLRAMGEKCMEIDVNWMGLDLIWDSQSPQRNAMRERKYTK